MKRIKITYLVVGLITLLLALALWPSIPWQRGSGDQLQNILSRGELRVSTLDASQTFFNGATGDRGFDYELASRFADYLGVKLVLIPHKDFDSLFSDLKSGKADMLASGLVYNAERLKSFRTGPEYYTVLQQVLYRQGSVRPKSYADIKGNMVVSAGSAHISTLEDAKKKFPDLNWGVTRRYSPAELMQQVAEGKLKYTLGDSVTVALLQRVYPRLAVAFDASDDEPVTWYFSKKADDDSLYAAMLDFFSQISEDGTLEKLEEKYLGHVGNFDFVDTRAFLNNIDAKLSTLQPFFEKYAGNIDWRLLAAISYQESHWDPDATSPTGVRGMMMLTRATAQGLGVSDRLDTEESIRGGALYLNHIIDSLPTTIDNDDKIWFALAAYNMGYGHMLDARAITAAQNGNPDSWVDVKQRLPLLNQKRYYSKTTYGYARGTQAFNYVENIRKYQISLVGYLMEKEKQKAQALLLQTQLGAGYPAVSLSALKNAGG
ncbi:membrane-bound lytic murein transglycosylase MltF [Rouxiella badensis]|uniref:Membrane-bound lytic murein transglycosylase F n=1 Tax=Rouxiella badensis TaxID=1646377 RepID=A0A1X0WJJ2_9GAMM|nr:membrane-bound lytic murein transglycosylase MltF [Rouxiella badensis]MCC3702103.1 membrane-bound lytic murein transglycosylase MltF [Rouxiella badensis]MCC3717109.1 membrane-bound lytic murein transglycosylase MltF [Rouxiella badensis]MCC3728205.1 membrane-bound lytic murein transglycosylase MltF [Rouxiella badensis]MCC3732109.1 membrane-bound lytic murein transglycosylase MltF [Rouxiella badensis]MCC3739949.1 membrane-bound lytic murein transglycosylase MltF [Rouxiella badensis]